jgi:hypothetical protein
MPPAALSSAPGGPGYFLPLPGPPEHDVVNEAKALTFSLYRSS